MNERITFIVAALVGDLTASVFVYLIAPLGPLCVAFPGLLNYSGQHVPLAAIVWLLIWTAAWLTFGPRVMRLRQNLSTKILLLVKLGIVGVVIDNAVSLFQQYVNSPEMAKSWLSSSVCIGLVERSLIYAIDFAVVVLVSYMISRTRKPTETPPPDFGRE